MWKLIAQQNYGVQVVGSYPVRESVLEKYVFYVQEVELHLTSHCVLLGELVVFQEFFGRLSLHSLVEGVSVKEGAVLV